VGTGKVGHSFVGEIAWQKIMTAGIKQRLSAHLHLVTPDQALYKMDASWYIFLVWLTVWLSAYRVCHGF